MELGSIMIVEACIDVEVISRILNHPEVRDWLTDDNSPGNYIPVIHPSVIYLVDDSKNGVIRIDPMNSVSCFVHIATTPVMRGKGLDFCKAAFAWGFERTRYRKVVAMIPEYNERVIRLVNKLGFVQEGTLKNSFLKNWKLVDQVIYGLSKGDTQCQ